ncbi:SERTA domain-containing protein 3 [Marasmius crinis-equi]|uniref:SERTA domain-containing protein 3 n=1 Tax=Marasmius crinis-equi TaxID=585013 RepID=A0ABR3EMF4_9AGAR
MQKAKDMLEEDYQKKCSEYSSVMIPKDSKELDLEDELQKTKCRRALASVVEPFLNFVRAQTGMAVFFQAGIELDHPDRGRAFDIVSLSSVPEGLPSFAKFNLPFFRDSMSREFANWLRTIKRHQIEAGVEFPEFIDQESADGRAASQAVPTTAKEVEAEGGKPPTKAKGRRSAKKTKNAAASSPKSTSATSSTPTATKSVPDANDSSTPPAMAPPELPERPVLDPAMPFLERRALTLEWDKEVQRAKGRLQEARKPSSNRSTAKKGPRKDDDEYDGSSSDKGSGEEDESLVKATRRYSTRSSTTAARESNDNAKNSDDPEEASLPAQESSRDSDPDIPAPPGNDMDDIIDSPSLPLTNITPVIDDAPSGPVSDVIPPVSTPVANSPIQIQRTDPEHAPGTPAPTDIEMNVIEKVTPEDDVGRIAVEDVAKVVEGGEMTADEDSEKRAGEDVNAIAKEPFDDPLRLLNGVDIPQLSQPPYPIEASDSEFVRGYASWLMSGPQVESSFWTAVVFRWIELEELLLKLGDDPTALAVARRPNEFKKWFKDGRVWRPGGVPLPSSITLPGFRDIWWKWWNDILKFDRAALGIPGNEEEAEPFGCHGKDGFVLILVALKWWFGAGGAEDRDGLGHWEHAMKVAFHTMGLLLKESQKRLSRPETDLPNERPPSKSLSTTSSSRTSKPTSQVRKKAPTKSSAPSKPCSTIPTSRHRKSPDTPAENTADRPSKRICTRGYASASG